MSTWHVVNSLLLSSSISNHTTLVLVNDVVSSLNIRGIRLKTEGHEKGIEYIFVAHGPRHIT